MLLQRMFQHNFRRKPHSGSLRLIIVIGFAFTVLVVQIAIYNTSVYSEYILRSLNGPVLYDDPELLRYIRNEILQAPSTEPYNFGYNFDKKSHNIREESEFFYREHLGKIFKSKRDGFYVEAGALDGHTMSNTLWLEVQLGWKGLLVEADAVAFHALTNKHRKAWSANVCLSPHPYASKELFEERSIHAASDMVEPMMYRQRSMNKLSIVSDKKTIALRTWSWVQCIPLQSLLSALEVFKVDLLVLDVEGVEMMILEHFDLKKFDVQILCIEWKNMNEMENIVKNIESRGYKLLVRNFEDLIFAKKGSPYEDYRL